MNPVGSIFRFMLLTGWIFAAGLLWLTPAVTSGSAILEAQIKVDRLNLRSKPSLKSRTLAVLNRPTRVLVVENQGNWLKVKYKKTVGYLRNNPRYVKIIPTERSGSQSRREMTQAREKALTLEKQIKSSQAAVVKYTRKEAAVIRSLDKIERSLHRARQRVASGQRDLARIDNELGRNQRDLDTLQKQIGVAESYASGRLVALYKMSWLGQINILASADSMGALLQRERALSKILDQDARLLEKLERDYNQLEALQKKQRERRAAKAVIEREYRLRADEMLREKSRKSSVLSEIRGKKSLELAAIEIFKEDARNLDQTIQQLGRALEREKAQAAARKDPPPGKPPESFTARKGLLKLPVKGKIKNPYGAYKNEKFNTMNFRSGIDISADRGEPVHAVFPGRVLYSSWFKGYGNMLIIDHGGHYYTVYAHVEEIFKQKGEVVEDNEVIATVGDTGSLEGPGLYFEVRYHGKPLDPANWIRKG